MAQTLSHRDVEDTIRVNQELIRSADHEVRQLREERRRADEIITRARRRLRRLTRSDATA